MNETALKILIGFGIAVLLSLGIVYFKHHYIEVGVKKEQNRIALVAVEEALRQATVNANALKDAASRVAKIKNKETTLSGALNSSEVLNHEETNTPCLSDARRLRIDAIR